MPAERTADALVIGGGLHGLAAAWNLRRLGAPRVILLERFRAGHTRGSSHGPTRITRSAYPSPVYVRLLQAANREDWPRLEAESGARLRFPARACFFGPSGGLYDEFARTMAHFEDEASFLTPLEAARRFPELRFDGAAGAIEDRTAGVVAAARTLDALRRGCAALGVTILEDLPVTRIEAGGDVVRAIAPHAHFVAGHMVVAAGAWSSALLPFLAGRVTVLRQTVGYFRLPPRTFDPAAFPIWAYLGRGRNDFYYGLPQFDGDGVKAARHRTLGDPDDPDAAGEPSAAAIEDLERVLGRVFAAPPEARAGAETCLYGVTATEDFAIGLHPGDPRIAFGAGFSGHGFKFGPLTGRILAELCLAGRSSVPEFEEHRAVFAAAAGIGP